MFMKKRIWLGVLAIVLVFGLVFVSCDDADDNGGGNAFIGGTLNLSGQVWTLDWDNDPPTWAHFTGTRATVTSDVGGSGSITNGQLSFSVGTPSDLVNMQQLFDIEEMEEMFNNFSLSPSGARGIGIDQLEIPGDELLGNVIATSNSFESVVYIYVDRDVRMTGTGGTITWECDCEEWDGDCFCSDCDCDDTLITRNLNLNLRAGWNAITVIEEWNPNTRTRIIEMTAGASPRARWMLLDDGDDYSLDISPATENLGSARSLFRSRSN